jgi:hypothetical protein
VFFTAIAGSLAGAFAGAYGAQRIAERSKNRDELLKEIRNTNATISLAFGICNSLLAMKKQHVKSLKENFEAQKEALLEHQQKMRAGQILPGTVFNFLVDFQTLSLLQLPIDILQSQIFEKLSLVGRPLNLTTTLSQTTHSLNASLEKRNQLIEFYKAKATRQPISPSLYFGLPQGGHINQDYPCTVYAIYNQTDDGIYFSRLLCKDLVEHGKQVVTHFKKQYGKGAPNVSEPDFNKAVDAGLMPNDDNYADWTSSFIKKSGLEDQSLFVRMFPTFVRVGKSVMAFISVSRATRTKTKQ